MALARQDFPAIIDRLDDSIVWKGVYGAGPHVPTSGERHGKNQVAEFFKQVAANANFSRFEPKDFIATGDKVVALGHYTATTPLGKKFDSDFAMVFTFRSGKIVEFQEFMNSAALDAAYAVAAV
ncbi:MAG TPA: nuclear transport factor 2 family protein [Vicinamibacterales bacterium]